MNLVKRARVESTGIRKPRYSALTVSVDSAPTGEIRPGTLDKNEEHQLKLTVVCSFWANQAQYRDALSVAEKVLVREVYRDVLSLTSALRSALMGHDIDRALQIVDEIDEQIGL